MIELPRAEQDLKEFGEFLDIIEALQIESILEIGVHQGGTLSRFAERFPWAVIVGIDPHPTIGDWSSTWADLHSIVGCSQDPQIQSRAMGYVPSTGYDVVFIDGDHSAPSVMLDWEWARRIARKVIAFHDISRDNTTCEVWPLWEDLEANEDVNTLALRGGGWGNGIGMVFV